MAVQLDDTETLYQRVSSNHPSKEFPSGIHIQPLNHQKKIYAALSKLEDDRCIDVPAVNAFLGKDNKHSIGGKIHNNTIVYSDPLGSGKSLIVLAIIANKRVPRLVREYRTDPNKKFTVVTRRNNLIWSNAIIVGIDMVFTWVEQIEKNTNLKVFVVKDHHSLKDFYIRFNNLITTPSGPVREIINYDIVLIKNGTVTGDLSYCNIDQSPIPMVDAMAAITKGHSWSRVFYDDFDIHRNDLKIFPAVFTYYISSTTSVDAGKRSPPVHNPFAYYHSHGKHNKNYNPDNWTESDVRKASLYMCETPEDQRLKLIKKLMHKKIGDVKMSATLKLYNYRCTDQLIKASVAIPQIEAYNCVIANPDDQYMKLMGVMNDDAATNLMEMLNGDAFKTAADSVGCSANSVADIFQKLLDNKKDDYIKGTRMLEVLAQYKKCGYDMEYTATDAKKVAAKVNAWSTHPEFEYQHPIIADAVATVTSRCNEMIDQYNKSLERVRRNIAEGMCQVCKLDYADGDMGMTILKCCGLIICDICTPRTTMLAKVKLAGGKTRIEGHCPMCKAKVIMPDTFIFIHDGSMDKLVEAGQKNVVETLESAERLAIEHPPAVKQATKMSVLDEILNGKVPEMRKSQEIESGLLIQGAVNVPVDSVKDIKRKFIVFCNYDETLNLIEKHLTQTGRGYIRLGHRAGEIYDRVQEFNTTDKLLIVNSIEHCAGLNLQAATTVIYFHKFVNKKIEQQVCGRAQRIGRQTNLEVYYLLYNNETYIGKDDSY